jgi:predicted outer membrane repeat protein
MCVVRLEPGVKLSYTLKQMCDCQTKKDISFERNRCAAGSAICSNGSSLKVPYSLMIGGLDLTAFHTITVQVYT